MRPARAWPSRRSSVIGTPRQLAWGACSFSSPSTAAPCRAAAITDTGVRVAGSGSQGSSTNFSSSSVAMTAGRAPAALTRTAPLMGLSSTWPVRLVAETAPSASSSWPDTSARRNTPSGRVCITDVIDGASLAAHPRVVRRSGAIKCAAPVNSGPLAARGIAPCKVRVASPGKSALTSRTVRPARSKSKPPRNCRIVPPAKVAASTERSSPAGNATSGARSRTGSHASSSSRPAATATSIRGSDETRSVTAPRAAEPFRSSTSSSATTSPSAAVSRPSARHATAGIGNSSDKFGPRATTCPAKAPSLPSCPVNRPPLSRNTSSPSRLISSPALPSRPGRASRPVNRTLLAARWPDPATESVPVSGSVSNRASIPVTATVPTVTRLRSSRARSPVSQAGGRWESAPGAGGQGRRRSAPSITSSCASIRPASSGISATRSRSACAVSTTPSPVSSTSIFDAFSSGWGSNCSVTSPPIRTGRPKRELASDSMLPRCWFQSSSPGTTQVPATRMASSTATPISTARPVLTLEGSRSRPSLKSACARPIGQTRLLKPGYIASGAGARASPGVL